MSALDSLMPGQRVTYFSGPSLANARQTERLDLAHAIWRAALRGEVWLVQRRVEGGFQYIAIGRRSIDRNPVRPNA